MYLRGDLSLEHPSRKRPQVALGAILRGCAPWWVKKLRWQTAMAWDTAIDRSRESNVAIAVTTTPSSS